jgi:hypothetical protein
LSTEQLGEVLPAQLVASPSCGWTSVLGVDEFTHTLSVSSRGHHAIAPYWSPPVSLADASYQNVELGGMPFSIGSLSVAATFTRIWTAQRFRIAPGALASSFQ